MTMDVTKAIVSRRSIRKYTTEPVSDEDIEALLNAAMHAPSGVNEQPSGISWSLKTGRRLLQSRR